MGENARLTVLDYGRCALDSRLWVIDDRISSLIFDE